VGSSQSRSKRAAAPGRFAFSPGALKFDGGRIRPAVAPIALGGLLGQSRGSLTRVGDPHVQRRATARTTTTPNDDKTSS